MTEQDQSEGAIGRSTAERLRQRSREVTIAVVLTLATIVATIFSLSGAVDPQTTLAAPRGHDPIKR